MKTAFQYIRISDEDQSNFSVSGQQLINEEYARRNNIIIVKTFVDEGYSAKNFNRPGWKQLESELTKNRVDYLVIWKYDRLIRNTLQGLIFIEKLEQKLNITLLSVMENYSIDPHDPYFFKHRAEMLVDAEFERRRISDRTRMGIWSGKSQGRYLGVAPYGYINQRDKDDKPILIVNPEQKKIIAQMFYDYLDGKTFAQILVDSKKSGFAMTGKEIIKRLLSNHIYGGLIKVRAYKSDPEKIVTGLHEPIVPEDIYWKTFYRLQENVKPIGPKINDENLPLRGFVLCQCCGAPHTGAKCKGRSAYYYYYWCNKCRGKNFKAEKVHEDMSTILKGLSLNERLIKALHIQTEQELDSINKNKKQDLSRTKREYDELQKQIKSLEKKYIGDKIDEDTYQKWYPMFKNDLNKKRILISDMERTQNRLSELYIPYLQYLGDLDWLYQKAHIEDKQPFLRTIFPGGLIAKNEGYRTAFINETFAMNTLSLGALMEVKNKRGSSFSDNPPSWVANGDQIEPILEAIFKILKAA